jgi:hypothetical protein
MKNQIVALVEAVRLARLELDCYRDPSCGAAADWTLARLSELLESKAVNDAMAALVPEEEGPSIVPEKGAVNLTVPYPWRSH